jgi:hypothetical protein
MIAILDADAGGVKVAMPRFCAFHGTHNITALVTASIVNLAMLQRTALNVWDTPAILHALAFAHVAIIC